MKNQVIEVLNKEHGKKVIEYWKSIGVDTKGWDGSNTKENGFPTRYYGVIDECFWCYSIDYVKGAKAEIIELPNASVDELTSERMERAIYLKSKGFGLEDRPFPKLMLVSSLPFENKIHTTFIRVVVASGDGYAVAVKDCESWDDYIKLQKAGKLDYSLWKYHQEIPDKVIISKAEIAEKFGIPIDFIKIVD
jgi:hypothetical protein